MHFQQSEVALPEIQVNTSCNLIPIEIKFWNSNPSSSQNQHMSAWEGSDAT